LISGRKNPNFQHPNYVSDEVFYSAHDQKDKQEVFETQYKASSLAKNFTRDSGFTRNDLNKTRLR